LATFDWKKSAVLRAAIQPHHSLVGRRLAPDRATQVSFCRLLANPAVTEQGLLDTQAAANGLGAVTGHVLALTDTTAPDLRRQAGRLRPDTVGPLSSAGHGLGLFLRPVLCLAAAEDAPRPGLEVSSLPYWHRAATPAAGKDRARPLAEKESRKWLVAGQPTRQRLPQAASIPLVGDREGDVYEAWSGLLAFVMRRRDDRRLAAPDAHLAARPAQGRYALTVARTAATAPRADAPGHAGRARRPRRAAPPRFPASCSLMATKGWSECSDTVMPNRSAAA